jgi:hypothetical protein
MLHSPLIIDGVEIDRYSYYERGDVLYLMVGAPTGVPAADDDESLEGDTVFFDADGIVSGVTMIGPRYMLERDGTLNVTLPSRDIAVRWPREIVEPLLVETLRATPDRQAGPSPAPSSSRGRRRRARASRSARAASAGR